MYRSDVLALLGELEDGTLTVFPNGTFVSTDNGDEWNPDEVEAAVTELTAELAKLVRWAKLAPKYTPPGDPTNTGGLVDSDGIPY